MEVKDMLKEFPFLTRVRISSKFKLLGREEEVGLLLESLHKKRMKNTILIGPAGCGKTSIIEEFSRRVKDTHIVLQLDLTGMVAGTALRGEFEEKVFNCLSAVKEYNCTHLEKIILFIDEIHMMYSMGQCRESDTATLGNMIKPYLSEGSIIIVGATTNKEFDETIRQDRALMRRLSPIFIPVLEMSIIEEILYRFGSKKVSKELIQKVIEEASTLDGNFPDIGIELLDRCLARSSYRNEPVDEKMIEKMSSEMRRILEWTKK